MSEILPKEDKFKISFETTQKNWVIIEASKKPLINLMWIGFFIMIFGLFMPLIGSFKRADTGGIIRVGFMLLTTFFALIIFIKSFISARAKKN